MDISNYCAPIVLLRFVVIITRFRISLAFVLHNLMFSVLYFADHCLFLLSVCRLVIVLSVDFRLLITPLVSSNVFLHDNNCLTVFVQYGLGIHLKSLLKILVALYNSF